MSKTSPEFSPVVSREPEMLEFDPFVTVKVRSSVIAPSSSCAVGVSFIPITVIVIVAVSVAVPSVNV